LIAIFSPMDLGHLPNFFFLVVRFLSLCSSIACKKRAPETCFLNLKFSSKFWVSAKDSNASWLVGAHYCLHSWVNIKQDTPYKLWRLIVFVFINVSNHIDLESKCLAIENLIENRDVAIGCKFATCCWRLDLQQGAMEVIRFATKLAIATMTIRLGTCWALGI
jgi:hypothetical protein